MSVFAESDEKNPDEESPEAALQPDPIEEAPHRQPDASDEERREALPQSLASGSLSVLADAGVEESQEIALRREQEIGARHAALLRGLKEQGTLKDLRIAEAFQTMPRHLFLPDYPLEQVYEDNAVQTKQDGEAQSSCSQPTVVALMLAQLDLQPGEQVLEIGAGTGWNAALMAHLVGAEGHIVTIDLDADTAQRACENLTRAGVTNVEVICADGGYGYEAQAPYDAIIATAAIEDITPHWFDQLRPGGRLAAPLLFNTIEFAAVFHKEEIEGVPALVSRSIYRFYFMPLRGKFTGSVTRVNEPDLLQMSFETATGIESEAVRRLLRSWSRDDLLPALQVGDSTGFIDYLALRGESLARLVLFQSDGVSSLCALIPSSDSMTAIVSRWEESQQRILTSSVVRTYGEDLALVRLRGLAAEWETVGRPGLEQARIVASLRDTLPAQPDAYSVHKRWMEYRTTFKPDK